MLGGKSLGLKAATLGLSVSAHAAVALVAVHGGGSPFLAGPGRVELPAPELVIVEARSVENSTSEPVRAAAESHWARHKHAYPVATDHDMAPHDPSVPHVPLPGPTADRLAAPQPAVVEAPPTAPARFVLTVAGPGRGPVGIASDRGRESDTRSESAAAWAEGAVDSAATLLSGIAPMYTPEAESSGVETDVPVEIVVDDRGNVVGARALQHVGYGLDEAAVRSIRGYRFKPARRGGHPVAVRMRWLVRFQLR